LVRTRIAATVEVELAGEIDRLAKQLGEGQFSYVVERLLGYALQAVRRGDLEIPPPSVEKDLG